MAGDALGLADLVAAMPDAAAVLDRHGRIIVSNTAWAEVDPAVGPLFGDLAKRAAIVVRGSAVVGEHRFFEVVATGIGESGDYLLAGCREMNSSANQLVSEARFDRDEVTGMASRDLLVELLRHALMMSIVRSAAEKTGARRTSRILRGQALHLRREFQLAHCGRDIKIAMEPSVIRHELREQLVDRTDADRLEHCSLIFGSVEQVTHELLK